MGDDANASANMLANGWQGRIDLVRRSRSSVKHLGKPRAMRRASIGGKWAPDEDAALRAIVNEHGAKNWKKIAKLLGPTRTDVQCLHRWNKVLKPGLHKGAWSEAEDKIVREMVSQNTGEVKWSAIAARLPGRIGKQCRERWFNHLDPVIKRGDWTGDEDRVLFEAQKHFGNRWCEISKILPGRTENAVKNRWNSSTMRRWLKDRNLTPGNGQPIRDLSIAGGLESTIADFHVALAAAGVQGIDASALLVSESDGDDVEDVSKSSKKRKSGARNNSYMESSESKPNLTSSRMPAHLRPPGILTSAGHANDTNQRIVELLGQQNSSPEMAFNARGTRTRSRAGRVTRDAQDQYSSTYVYYGMSNANTGSYMDDAEPEQLQLPPPTDSAGPSPVSRSLARLQACVAVAQEFAAAAVAANATPEPVPITLLSHFHFLNEKAQKDLMRQLVERFQRTNATPRGNESILPTPRFEHSAWHTHGMLNHDERMLVQSLTSPVAASSSSLYIGETCATEAQLPFQTSPRRAADLSKGIDPNVFEHFAVPAPTQQITFHPQTSILPTITPELQPLGLDDFTGAITEVMLSDLTGWVPVPPTPLGVDLKSSVSHKPAGDVTVDSISGNHRNATSLSKQTRSHFATAGNETHRHAQVFTDLSEPAIDTAVLVAYQVINKTPVAEAIMKMLTQDVSLNSNITTNAVSALPAPGASISRINSLSGGL